MKIKITFYLIFLLITLHLSAQNGNEDSAYEHYGYDVAIDGNYSIVSANPNSSYYANVGHARIFKRTGNSRVEQAKLTASDGISSDKFGVSVSISGDYAVVGAPNASNNNGVHSGAVYIFKRTGSSWDEQSKIFPSDGASEDSFGSSVSINGDYIIVGASGNLNNSGAAYVFKRTGTSWLEESKLVASDATVEDIFGSSVSIDGEFIVIGAYGNDDNKINSGAAYIFRRTGVNWTEETKLLETYPSENNHFGRSVAISNNTVIIGASKIAYIFKRESAIWSEESKLYSGSVNSNNNFGCSVAISGDIAIVGDPYAVNNLNLGFDMGRASVFSRTGNSWSLKTVFNGNQWDDLFGASVAISANSIVVGAPNKSDNPETRINPVSEEGKFSGTAYFYEITNPDAFITRWKTTTANESIIIPTVLAGSCYSCEEYSYSVDWGDGNIETNITTSISHVYDEPGIYDVKIIGQFPRIRFSDEYGNPNANDKKIIDVIQWGSNSWTSMRYAFANCANLTISATDSPNLARVLDMSHMFKNTRFSQANIGNWDVSNVEDMSYMFVWSDFNGEISNWNVSKVKDMSHMFHWTPFNQDISGWDVSNVILMNSMFQSNFKFNQDISSWNVSNVIDMSGMFNSLSNNTKLLGAFNQDLSKWVVSKVANMTEMFYRSSMSIINYDKILIGWSNLTDLQQNVNFGASNLFYCNSESSRNKLINDFGWSITDAGNNCDIEKITAQDDDITVDKNTTNNIIAVLANDDFGGNGANATHPLTFKNGALTNASIEGGLISVGDNGTANDLSDDVILYSAPAGFIGTDSFQYVITDADGDASTATVTVTVSGGVISSNTPTAANDAVSVNAESADNSIDVLANDDFGIDGAIDGGLTMTNGTLTSASLEGGAISIDNKGTLNTMDDVFKYTPPAGFTGIDSFQYTITDASGDASTGVVTVTVTSPTALLNTPTAVDDTASVDVDSTGNIIDVLSNDTPGTDGYAATPIASATVTTVGAGSVSIDGNNNIVFEPTTGFEGIAMIEYTIEDANGDTDTGSLTVTVGNPTPPSTTPTAIDDSAVAVQNGAAITIIVLSNDSFGTEGPSATHPLTFKNGSLVNASTEGGSITISDNGTANLSDDVVVYTPAKDFNGTDTFEYTITDASGDASTATVTITVNASSVVSVPTAVDDTATVAGDSTLHVIDVLANDTAGLDGYIDNGLTLKNGTLTGASTEGGLISVDTKGTDDTSDDEFTYSPKEGFTGTDTFEYVITDASGDASTGLVTVTVTALPALGYSPDTATVTQNSTNNIIDVMANDTDDAGFGSADTRFLIESANHLTGTTTKDGTVALETYNTPDTSDDVILYTPLAGFVGEDTFNYVPGNDRNALVLVTVTVEAATIVNGTPTAVDDTYSIDRTSGTGPAVVYINVTGNDSFGTDGPNATHPLVLINGKTDTASNGGQRIKIDDNGTPNDLSDDRIAYYSTDNASVTSDSFIYTITDASGDASTATATITLSATSPKTAGVNSFGNFTVKDNAFVTYPNPSKGALKSELFSTISTKATVLLFDITGKTIYKGNTNIVQGKNELDFNFQAKGILFLKIVSQNVNFGVSKVVFE